MAMLNNQMVTSTKNQPLALHRPAKVPTTPCGVGDGGALPLRDDHHPLCPF